MCPIGKIPCRHPPQCWTGSKKNGYKLPLLSEPPSRVRHNQQSALVNKEFVDQAISELLNDGCTCRVPSKPHVCSPLSIVTSAEGKNRLVINLRYLNQYLKRDAFKYEDLSTLMSIISPNDFYLNLTSN